jgi:hypothetical protein
MIIIIHELFLLIFHSEVLKISQPSVDSQKFSYKFGKIPDKKLSHRTGT